MNGKELKEKLRAEGINLSALAQKMGYNTDQNLHSVLGAKDVRSGLIEDLSKALGKPIGWFYGEAGCAKAAEGSIAVSGNNNSVAAISERFISLLEKKDEQMDKLIDIIKSKTSLLFALAASLMLCATGCEKAESSSNSKTITVNECDLERSIRFTEPCASL